MHTHTHTHTHQHPYIHTDFNRWKDEDESDSESENPYDDSSLNNVSWWYMSSHFYRIITHIRHCFPHLHLNVKRRGSLCDPSSGRRSLVSPGHSFEEKLNWKSWEDFTCKTVPWWCHMKGNITTGCSSWYYCHCMCWRTGNQGKLPSVMISGVARTWVMPGHSTWSLPVERCTAVISLHKARKKNFAFIFQLSGWALVVPSCFVLMYEDLCSIRLTCT